MIKFYCIFACFIVFVPVHYSQSYPEILNTELPLSIENLNGFKPINEAGLEEKAIGTVIWSEDFTGGFPAGWSVVDNNGLGYDWILNDVDVNAAYTYGDGAAISSTSGGNHMLLFGDGYNTVGGSGGSSPVSPFTSMNAYFQTSAISMGAGYSSVLLRWEQKFRECCSSAGMTMTVVVSRDPTFAAGPNTVTYEANPGLASGLLSADPVVTSVDISAVAGSFYTGDIYIRYHKLNNSHYFWMVDDIQLVDAPAYDLELSNASWYHNTTEKIQYTGIPLDQIASITFDAEIENIAGVVMNNTRLQATISGSGSGVANSIPIDLMPCDSSQIETNTGYTPIGIGTYNVLYSVIGDSNELDTTNNNALTAFDVTQYEYGKDLGFLDTTFSTYGADTDPYEVVVGYEVNATTYFEAIRVCLGDATLDGAEIYYNIYYDDGTGSGLIPSWTPEYTGAAVPTMTVNTADLTAIDSANWITLTFPTQITVNPAVSPIIYAVVGSNSYPVYFGATNNNPDTSNFASVFSPSLGQSDRIMDVTPMVRLLENLGVCQGIVEDSIVACDNYTWLNGVTYSSSIDSVNYLASIPGCDTLYELDLTILNSTSGIDYQSVCDSLTWLDGNTYSNNDTSALFVLTNSVGCDSVVTLNLVVNSNTGTDTYVVCDTSLIWLDGNTYTASNYTATHVLTNAAGCDSLVTLDLTVNSNAGIDSYSLCDSSLIWIDGITYTSSNDSATFVLVNAAGCDSTVTLDLTIKYSSSGLDAQTACDTYTWIDGIDYTSSDTTATYTLTNAVGCDSLVELSLTILNSSVFTDVHVGCDSLVWIDGTTYTSSNNTAVYTIMNAAGCDSVVTLDLTIGNNTGIDSLVVCDTTLLWIDGNTYTASNYTATHTLTNAAGCDSVVTLALTVNNNTGIDTHVVCDSLVWIDGNTYVSDNDSATYLLINAAGCDSLVTLDLTVNNSTSSTDVRFECDSFSWIDGYTYTSSNDSSTHTIVNAAGCDSLVTLDLTLAYSSSSTDFYSVCDSLLWIDGNTYTSNDTSTVFVLTNTAGCDSVVTLNLSINNNTGIDSFVVCDTTLAWIDGNTYTTSNYSATHTLTNAAGCDSVVTLDLTVQNNASIDTHVFCDSSLLWIDGNTYTASNATATHTLINAAGCDSVVTLDLTILNSTVGVDSHTACDSYTWIDGITYTSSNNTAMYLTTNLAGCDSTIMLDLDLGFSSTFTDFQSACDSLAWIDGNTYFSSTNSATYLLPNQEGCDSVITLHLSLVNSSTAIETIQSCGAYTWIDGVTYFSDNDSATYTITNVAGCDSTITLNLSVDSNNFLTDFSADVLSFSAPPFETNFTNNTPIMGDYSFTWDFGDGIILQSNDSTVDHEYLFNGLYSVSLIATNTITGCSDTLLFNDYISCAGGSSCSHAAEIDQSGPLVACLNDSLLLSCNDSSIYTYQWTYNGTYIAGAENAIYYPTQSGNYAVAVIDSGCPITSTDISVTINQNPIEPVLLGFGEIAPCVGGSITLSVFGVYDIYSWSTGDSSEVLIVDTIGSYTVTVANIFGCESTSQPFIVDSAAGLSPPEICIAGVNSVINFNQIIWEKPFSAAIDSFYVYQETSSAGVYQKIGANAYSDTSIFNDLSSDPSVQDYRYKLSLVDSCGIESELSEAHRTIHLTVDQGLSAAWDLTWSDYEGVGFTSYNIYRGYSAGILTYLSSVGSGLTSFTDLTPPAGVLYYQIEIVSGYTCNVSNTNYGSSRSNIGIAIPPTGSVDILNDINVALYPNPSDGKFTIETDVLINGIVVVTNSVGQRIVQAAMQGNRAIIDLGSNCSAGLYFVSIYDQTYVLRKNKKLLVH